MKLTKSQLKQIIKEELNEMKPLALRMADRRRRQKHRDPGYGNLTMDDVHAVLNKLEMYDKDPKAIWDEFKDLNNADDLEDKLWQAQAFFGK